MRNRVICYINGIKHELDADKSSMMLADYLRYDQCLTGTKVVCAEGDCGACSVLYYSPIKSSSKINLEPINSCITPMAILDGAFLITIEALDKGDRLHVAQDAMVTCHGSQCGFCTPGFVIALSALVEKKINNKESTITEKEAKNATTGNLCRCTGYDAIIEAATKINIKEENLLTNRYITSNQIDEMIKETSSELEIKNPDYHFFAPNDLTQACQYLSNNPNTQIIGSSTDLGVIHNKRKIKLDNLLSLHLVKDLYQCIENKDHYEIGANVSLTKLRNFLKNKNDELVQYLDIFASPQIKNIATLAGNIANASPIGDTPPALIALNAKLEIYSTHGPRVIELSIFFKGYRSTELQSGELISKILIPKINKQSFYKLYKNSNRKDLDISTVNFAIHIDENKNFTLAAGGIAATPLRLHKTEEFLNQNTLNSTNIYKAIDILHSEYTPLSDVRGTQAYRRVLVENYFKRAISEYMEIKHV